MGGSFLYITINKLHDLRLLWATLNLLILGGSGTGGSSLHSGHFGITTLGYFMINVGEPEGGRMHTWIAAVWVSAAEMYEKGIKFFSPILYIK